MEFLRAVLLLIQTQARVCARVYARVRVNFWWRDNRWQLHLISSQIEGNLISEEIVRSFFAADSDDSRYVFVCACTPVCMFVGVLAHLRMDVLVLLIPKPRDLDGNLSDFLRL